MTEVLINFYSPLNFNFISEENYIESTDEDKKKVFKQTKKTKF